MAKVEEANAERKRMLFEKQEEETRLQRERKSKAEAELNQWRQERS